MREGQRLVGVELHAYRPGEAASFYAWLLGPASVPGQPGDWSPVTMLFRHAVCGIHQVEDVGPPASWVPVIAVPGLARARERAQGEGWRVVEHHGRCYVVDPRGVWTRLVDSERLPYEIDPDAVGNTIAEVNGPDPKGAAAAYSRVLGLEMLEMVDDVADYVMMLDRGVVSLGAVDYDLASHLSIGPRWLVYFDVPDMDLTLERTEGVGVRVAVPLTKEDFNVHTVLVDPFGVPFGFCTYFGLDQSLMRVRSEDGEEHLLRDAVRLLIDPRA